jgi:hypothetical protein
MTGWRKRTIMEMAREAGIRDCTCSGEFGCLDAFAALVRENERDKWMERAHIMILGEREACAKVCDELANDENTDEYINAADWCAVRIRARKNHD